MASSPGLWKPGDEASSLTVSCTVCESYLETCHGLVDLPLQGLQWKVSQCHDSSYILIRNTIASPSLVPKLTRAK